MTDEIRRKHEEHKARLTEIFIQENPIIAGRSSGLTISDADRFANLVAEYRGWTPDAKM